MYDKTRFWIGQQVEHTERIEDVKPLLDKEIAGKTANILILIKHQFFPMHTITEFFTLKNPRIYTLKYTAAKDLQIPLG